MATIKIKFRPSTVEGKEGSIYYKVTHRRVVSQISTGYKIFAHEWNDEDSSVMVRQDDLRRSAWLAKMQAQILSEQLRLSEIANRLELNGEPYTAETVRRLFRENDVPEGFIAFARKTIDRMEEAGRPVAEKYASSLRSFIRFHGEEDVAFSDFDSNLMVAYEAWLLGQGLCRNTTSYYMRNLHAIYNRAASQQLVAEGTNPFRHVYTGVDKTAHRALSKADVNKLQEADLSQHPKEEHARDMFMLSLYTRGMSFVDMAYLPENAIKGGAFSYERHKTHRRLTVKCTPELTELIRRHHGQGCDRLLPIVTAENDDDARRQYITASQRINRHLKKLGERLGLPIKLTLYVARHTWATLAQEHGVPHSTISRSLGHDSERTTAVYLGSINTSDIDKANEIVLRSLRKKNGKKKRENVRQMRNTLS